MAKEKMTENPEVDRLRDQLQRALADYANLARRVEEEKKAVVKFANVVLLAKFLEVLDALESAQKVIASEGLEFVIQKFEAILASEAIKEIPAIGANFDPNAHEAVDTIVGEDDGKIVEVLEKGYELDGKVIRPARVKVSKKQISGSVEEKKNG
jgi:molecular chaperone GrpE